MAACLLSGCASIGESRLNPFNWFGRSESVRASSAEEVNPLIPRATGILSRNPTTEPDLNTPIQAITELQVERVPGGAIIRAAGLETRQGAFDVEIVPSNEEERPEDGVLLYSLERQLPPYQTRAGTEQSRRVAAARFISDQKLRGVRIIRVEAIQNARQVRR